MEHRHLALLSTTLAIALAPSAALAQPVTTLRELAQIVQAGLSVQVVTTSGTAVPGSLEVVTENSLRIRTEEGFREFRQDEIGAEQAPGNPPQVELFGGYSYLPALDKYSTAEAGHGWAAAVAVHFGPNWGLVVDVDGQRFTNPGNLSSTDLSAFQCPGSTGCGLRGEEKITLRYFSVGPRVHHRNGRLTTFALAAFEVQSSRYSEADLARIGRADNAEFVERISVPQRVFYTRPYVFDTWDRPLEYYGDNVVGRARMAESSASAWGFGFGGGADVSIGRRFSIRLAQVNYSLGGFGEGPGRKLRIKTGIVFKYG